MTKNAFEFQQIGSSVNIGNLGIFIVRSILQSFLFERDSRKKFSFSNFWSRVEHSRESH